MYREVVHWSDYAAVLSVAEIQPRDPVDLVIGPVSYVAVDLSAVSDPA